MEYISHSSQSKIPAAIQQLGDKALGFSQAVGQFFPGNLLILQKITNSLCNFQNKFFLGE